MARIVDGPLPLLLALHVAFKFREGRAITGVEHLAPELDRDLRRIALHAGQQRGLDALQLLAGVLHLLFHQAGQRLGEGVGQQDAQEGAHQGRADHAAQHRRWLAHRAHGVDHAQHGRHDAEGGQPTGDTLDGGDSGMLFLVVST